MSPVGVVILAAGKGTRMRSRLPKVAHTVAGRAMLEHVLRTAAEAVSPANEETSSEDVEPDSSRPRYVVVVGHERATVQAAVRWQPHQPLTYVVQEPQLGTGDAVRTALAAFGFDVPETILVLYGDTPLIRAETLRALLDEHARGGATLTFLAGMTNSPTDYGRVLRDAEGRVRGIVEVQHASEVELKVPEVNSGIYCFRTEWLAARLNQLEPHHNGEYYLTDLVEIAVREGRPVSTVTASLDETAGVNDRVQLAAAERILRWRVLEDLMLSGVTVEDPATTYVEYSVRVGQDTVLRPGTRLTGTSEIGERCEIGPNSVIRDSRIGDGCLVLASWVEEAVMESGSRVGPMSHLRHGARLLAGANLGNFAEVKNATIGEDVQMHHFSYVGDATVGPRSNVAAGVITCNFEPDGKKYRTQIGADVFIGSDTMLIAPVTLGDGAMTGAGSVVNHDVPAGAKAIGMPARIRQPKQRNADQSSSTGAAHEGAAGSMSAPVTEPEHASTTGMESSPASSGIRPGERGSGERE
ncbi:MAG TPA: bifunctional UDP-N-acetylglucosamine diphosphorylase/glucosamine-1-phosphate N-acetyltransferase GlmU [Ktedonobacterales bacterium]|jgi:bifunctional UDP-N-acetylglucosamine pyrophosphorylase/glucosamine-1-phosphate N-acetyltransferase|nr:bifunctional UDP-N-acetylglucosamine diphosphorylase/glucosamine-1-phosphate N-acetyltransferase GlmU [Ktedonobacterales bacterium]